MSKTTILVTAASGTTSNATARHLLDLADKSKYHIRVGARSDTKIQELIQKGAEYVKFDFSDKKSVEDALKGVDYLWVTIPNPSKDGPAINIPQLIADFLDLVKVSSVKHLVFGSIDPSHIDPKAGYQMPAEFAFVENKINALQIPTTILRMGWFQENIISYHAEEITQGMYVEPIEDSKYTQVSVEDIGEAAATVLLSPEKHVGKSYHLTGPRAVGGADIASVLSSVLQRPILFESLPREHYAQGLQMAMSAEQVKFMIELYEIIRAGLVTDVSNDYTLLTGKPYISIEERYKQLKENGLLR